jgi:PAS domain S-box-containing protein
MDTASARSGSTRRKELGDMPGLEPEGAVDATFFARVIDLVAHPIFVKDREFRFVFLNQALCQMVGYPREEMIGKTDFDFFPETEARFFREKDIELFRSGEPVAIDGEPITDASGRVHILATTKVALRDDAGDVTHLVGIIHDITRLKEVEEALRHGSEVLEARVRERTAALEVVQRELLRKERLAVLGQLAGGLAHQIRNPLGAIANAASLLRRAVADLRRPELDVALEIIHEEVFRADRTITGLLDYARVREPDPRSVPVAELVERALESEHLPATIALTVEVAANLVVAVDAMQVQGALSNLVRNAVEAMPNGGTLAIRARGGDDGVIIEVRDTGVGLAPELQGRVFEPLVTTKPLGLGLGLSTARTLVEGQGGSIAFSSVPGRGTAFEIRLPASHPA